MLRYGIVLLLFMCPKFGLLGASLPFKGTLPKTIAAKYDELKASEARNSFDTHQIAFEVYNDARLAKDATVTQWAFLNYIGSLVEVDSLLKAKQLFETESEFEYSSYSWLKSYETLRGLQIQLCFGQCSVVENGLGLVSNNLPNAYAEFLASKLKAENLHSQGKLDLSRLEWLEVMNVSEGLKDSFLIAETHLGRAETYISLGKTEDAAKDLEVIRTYYSKRENKLKIGFIKALESRYYVSVGEFTLAIDAALEGYKIHNELGCFSGQAENLFVLGLAHSASRNWTQAVRYLNKSLQLFTQSGELLKVPRVILALAVSQKELGRLDKAIDYLLTAEKNAENGGQILVLAECYELLSQIQAQKQNFPLAYSYKEELLQLKDSLYNVQRTNAIEELEIQFKNERAEQELAILQQKQTLITNRWLTLALGMFLTIIIGVLVYDNQKRKHKQEKELLTTEDELRKAEIKIMTKVLAHNQEKLSAYTDHLLKKNDLVGELQDRVKTAVTDGDKAEADRLLNNISTIRILTEEDWEEFKALFDGVHQGLLARLLNQFENLTLAEQRLFLLMKLEMSTKQIANILGVSPDSVKKGRYRLKKKLDLEDTQTLQEFVARF